jgi:FixJ family two-component response regulator
MADQRKVIAIVDDEKTMLKAIDRLLTARGFSTQCFASAEEFLDSSTGRDAACLVLDIHLDGMSGIELRRRLKAVRSKLPVIFITATDDQSLHREAIEVGCVACLHKPFQSSLLIDAIDKATN